ncbi:Protein of unknown function [Pyronema omphalodes CBS 100304]|uniref:F-box domain-containing protein n=1 Tax=Pyronema omphalodes (strain CBS 100304) TaxID=1076935 RepID=U4L891_PYROM|nr:Protein of unknown function [Pyronema omphalodes CBS 100304]
MRYLPYELRREILCQISDRESLKALVFSSRDWYEIFSSERDAILHAVHSRQLNMSIAQLKRVMMEMGVSIQSHIRSHALFMCTVQERIQERPARTPPRAPTTRQLSDWCEAFCPQEPTTRQESPTIKTIRPRAPSLRVARPGTQQRQQEQPQQEQPQQGSARESRARRRRCIE